MTAQRDDFEREAFAAAAPALDADPTERVSVARQPLSGGDAVTIAQPVSSFTDRRDADDATWRAEVERLDRLAVADEDTVERVARAIAAEHEGIDSTPDDWEYYLDEDQQDEYRRLAEVAIAALKPAPGTDTSGQAVQRVLALADELERPVEGLTGSDGPMPPLYNGRDVAFRLRRAVAGPQHDGQAG